MGITQVFQITLTKIKKSEEDRHVQGSEDSEKPGNFRYVEKRNDKGMSTSPKLVCQHSVFSRQEGRGQLSCDKPKKIEQVGPLSTLQDRRFTLSKVHVVTRRLQVQIRHEGCLLFGSLTQKLHGQSSFSVVREAL